MDSLNTSLTASSLAMEARKFISEAQSAFNAKDVESACAVYANDAVVEFYTDGIHDRLDGIDEIKRGWQAIFVSIPDFLLKKELLLTTDSVVINEWFGSLDKRQRKTARGIEIWWFNEMRQVTQHRLYSFLDILEGDTLKGKLRYGLIHPLIGFRLERFRQSRRIAEHGIVLASIIDFLG